MIGSTFRLARLRQCLGIVVTIACLAATATVSWAQTWTTASPGDFLTASNWGGSVPNGIDASANIATQPTNAGNFTLNGSMTLGAFNYSNSQSRSLLGTGTLTLQKSSGNPEFNVENGSLTVDVAIVIPTTTKFQIDSVSIISGIISGAGILQKRGSGTLTLSANNTYTGGTSIINGTLQLGNNNRLVDTSRVSITSPGIFDLNSFSDTIGSLEGDGNVTLGSGTLTTGGDNTSTDYSGVISGTGALTKTGSGTMTLSGSNSYTGTTTISGGTLSGNTIADQGINSAFGRGNFNISNGATLDYTAGNVSTNRSIALGSGGGVISVSRVGAGATLTISGNISGAGSLTKSGIRALTLSGNNSYEGGTIITGGTVSGSTIADFGSNSSFGRGHITITTPGATFSYLGGTASTNRTFTLLAEDSRIDINNPAAVLTLTGAINGSGGLLKTDEGVLQLASTNSYAGATNITEGTLRLGLSERIPDGSAVTVSSPGTFHLNGHDETIGSLAGNGAVTLGGGTLTTGANGDSTSFSGTISGTGNFEKLGSGTQTLSGSNSYTGTTTINGGTLSGNVIANQGVDASYGRGDFAISNGARLEYTGSSASTNRTISLGSGGGAVVVESAAAVLTLTGAMSGLGDFVKQGSGILRLEGDNTYTGATTINQGILQLRAAERIPDGSALTIASGATFDIDIGEFNDEAVGSLSGDGNVQLVSCTLYVGGDNSSTTFSGTISGSVDGWLYKVGSGTFTFSGINSFSGPVGVGEGVLSGNTIGNVGVPSAFGTGVDDQPLFIEYGGTIEYTGPNASTNRPLLLQDGDGAISVSNSETTLIWDGVIDGEEPQGDFIKSGPGVLHLSNPNNSYTGTTYINDGVLQGDSIADAGVNSAFGQGNFAISNGARLEYTGSSASTNRTISLGSGGGAVVVESAAAVLTLTGQISGVGGLTKQGPGTLQLNADNTYTGSTTIAQGTLRLGNDERIPDGSALTIASGATFDLGDNNGETIGSLSGAGNVQLGDGILDVGSDNSSTTFSGTISGSVGDAWLYKSGSGTFTLSGINSNAGTVGVGGGVLSGNTIGNIGVPSAFGTGVWPLLIGYGGTLEYTGPNASTNRAVFFDVDGGAISVSNSGTTLILDGLIGGEGNLTKSGAGTLQLNANNTYGGSTTIAQGTLRLGDDERIPDGSALTIASGATFDIGDNEETVGSLSGAGNVQLSAGAYSALVVGGDNSSTTFSGTISGSVDGWLYKWGSGTFTLSGISSNSGPVGVGGGVLSGNTIGNIGVPSAFGTGAAIDYSLLIDGGTLEYTGPNASTNRTVSLSTGAGVISVSNSATTLFLDGLISGVAGLIKSGPGLLNLSNPNNSYTGTTYINDGVLQGNSIADAGVNSAFGQGNFVISNGATLRYTGGSVTTDRVITVGTGGGVIDVANAATSLTISGSLISSSGLTKAGAGTFVLTGNNQYTGLNNITGGTLSGNVIANQGVDASYGRGDFAISNGATLQYTGGTATTNRTISIASFGDATIDVTNAGTTLTFSGQISGALAELTKTGPGKLVLLAGNNNYATNRILEGTLSGNSIAPVANPSAFGTHHFFISNGATLEYSGASAGTNRFITLEDSGTISVTNSSATLTLNRSSGLSAQMTGTGDLIKAGDGVLELIGGAEHSGATIVDQGSLRLGAADRIPDASAVSLASATVFELSNFNEVIGSLSGSGNVALGSGNLTTGGNNSDSTYSGVISGTGGLTKQESGTMTLTGTNTYIGGTIINGGTLAVNGSITGPVTVNAGGTLGGGGLVDLGNVTNGGRVAPGNSPGILTIDGDYTQDPTGVLEIEVGGLTPGTEHDKLIVTGTAEINGVLEVPIINNFEPLEHDEITFLTAASVTGSFTGLVSPNLASVNQNLALEIIKYPLESPIKTEVRLRFAAPETDNQFGSVDAEPASWSDPDNWTATEVPGSVNIINLQNVAGIPQQINVDEENAQVHQLTITGNDAEMTVSVQEGKTLSATTGTSLGEQAAIELHNGNLVSPIVAVNDGALLAGNGTIRTDNLLISGGTLRPGFSVGHLDVDGNYQQEADGTLLMDVEGTQAGEWDTVDITGSVELGGTLRIDAAGFVLTEPGAPLGIISAQSLAAGTRFGSVETINNSDIFFAPIYVESGGGGSDGSGGTVDCSVGVCVAGFYKGDMNRNGGFDPADVTAFALALTRPLAYFNNYHIFGDESGNFDGFPGLDFDDIPGFRSAMGGGGVSLASLPAAIERFQHVPEPSSGMLITCGGTFILLVLRRRGVNRY